MPLDQVRGYNRRVDIVVEPIRNSPIRGTAYWGKHSVRCALGRNGVIAETAKREGDGATPVGSFTLRRVLWRSDRLPQPETRLSCIAIRQSDGWCDDPKHAEYNRPVSLPFAGSAEHLWRDDHLYDVVVVLGHNDDPPHAGMGSAIFLHVAKPDFAPTEGCVAMTKEDLVALLAEADPGDRLIVQPAD
jgi:L,D-peptidoglycan transpeptidase YkuD (ErfK/YbiS/YcfS/YnhG family)